MMRVARLKDILAGARANHALGLMKEPTLKDAHVYCVIHNISAQQYGPLLEKYIISKLNYKKNKASDCTGDCTTATGNKQIKASLGGAYHNKLHYVDIRLAHAHHIFRIHRLITSRPKTWRLKGSSMCLTCRRGPSRIL